MKTHPQATSGAAAVLLRLGRDDSFSIEVDWPSDRRLVSMTLTPSGTFALAHVHDRRWMEAAHVVTRTRSATLVLARKRARSLDDGSIEAVSSRTTARGPRLRRRLRIAPDGAWSSQFLARVSAGARIVGEGSAGSFTRRRIERDGSEAWSLAAETRAGRAELLTTTQARYSTGGTGTCRTMSFEGRSSSSGSWRLAPAAAGAQSWRRTLKDSDGSTREETQSRDANGGMSWKTETTSPPKTDASGTTTTTTVTTSVTQNADGSWTSTTTRETDEHRGRSATDLGQDTRTWESTSRTSDGRTITERGVSVVDHLEGTSTTTTSVTHADGSVEITTMTTDIWGSGTVHRTVLDKNGNVVRDTTTVIGSGNTGAGATGDEPEQDDEEDDESSDDDDEDDDEGDDDEGDDDSEEGGDSGMDWDGADEGPPSILPTHSASVFDVLADLARDVDPEGGDPIGRRVADALLRREFAVGRLGRDTGWGDASGSESAPDFALPPASIVIANVQPPTDDWGEWKDPRVHVAYATRLVETLTHAAGADLGACARVTRSMRDAAAALAAQRRG